MRIVGFMTNRGDWGRNIRAAREALGMTQTQLADLVGVRQPTIVRWEAGVNEPKFSHCLALARALNKDMADLFPIEDEGGEAEWILIVSAVFFFVGMILILGVH